MRHTSSAQKHCVVVPVSQKITSPFFSSLQASRAIAVFFSIFVFVPYSKE